MEDESQAPLGCSDPSIGCLISAFVNGKLEQAGQWVDMERFIEHALICEPCHDAVEKEVEFYEQAIQELELGLTPEEFDVELEEMRDGFDLDSNLIN